MKDCPKDLSKTARKVSLNVQEETTKKGGWAPQKPVVAPASIPGQGSVSLTTSLIAPFLNPDPLTHWNGPENIAQVRIDGESSWALLNSGSTINTVTPEFIKAHSLDVGPLSALADGTLAINGFGGVFFQPRLYHQKGSGRS